MHVAVACGGTGGHIFPGLATAHELMRRGHRVTLWLAGKDVESEAVKGWPGEIITASAQGLPSGFSWRTVPAAFRLVRAIKQVKRDMQRERPEVVLAMGSYASVGPVGAALRLRIPFILHESNVVPGRAVRLFARRAAAVAACFEETHFYLRRCKLVLTGMPLRAAIMTAAATGRTAQAVPPRLLVMGGSRGARALNELVPATLTELHRRGEKFSVIHLAGEKDAEFVSAVYQQGGVPAKVLTFTREIEAIYAVTDFAICRSGAATCAELSAFGIPALLIPYPHAIHDHQTHNARALEKLGAADMVPEQDLTPDWLQSYIQQMIRREDLRQRMAAAALSRASHQGVTALSDLVEEVVRGGMIAR